MKSSDLTFGYKPETAVEATALWGARLLVEGDDRVTVLWDRQDCRAEKDEDRWALVAKLDGKDARIPAGSSVEAPKAAGAISALLGWLGRELRHCRLDISDRKVFDRTFRGVRFRGSPNGSHGYVYVLAHLDSPAIVTCDGCGTGGAFKGTKTYPGVCEKCRDELAADAREERSAARGRRR